MPNSVQVNGRTVEEAINKGLAELGLSRDQVDIELISSPAGATGEALVRLTAREDADAYVMSAPAPGFPHAPTLSPAPPDTNTNAAPGSAAESNSSPVVAQQVLEQLLSGMGIRSQVVVRADDDTAEGPDFVLDIVGADLGILIGRRGETLRDLEYLSRLIVAQKVSHNVRFAVDVEGYRARRERVLRELARRMADRVKQSHQPITLEAMPPHERRIVHITLRDHPSVKTQSIGEGEHRRVMILPK